MGLLPTGFRLDPIGLADRLRAEGDGVERLYREVGREVAQALGAWVLPGSILVAGRAGTYRHMAAVFGPDGAVIGEQYQTHAFQRETEMEVSSTVSPIPVGSLRVGILLGADPFVPEVSRVLTLEGTDLLVAPLAPRAPYSSERALSGLWQEVQQNQVFGLETGLSGPLFEGLADGKMAFLAPCEVTPGETGFLGEAGYFVREGWRREYLELSELRRAKEIYPLLRHLNPGLYRRYFPLPRRGDLK